jgi:signal transduction histidine kinase
VAKPDLLKGEGLSLVQGAANRIEAIAEELLRANRSFSNPIKAVAARETAPEGPVSEKAPGYSVSSLTLLIHEHIKSMSFELLASGREKVRLTLIAGPAAYENGFYVNYHRDDFERLLTNLLKNSLEAIDADGFVSVEIDVDGFGLIVSIRDNGHGISVADQEQLFQRGFSVGKAEGNGLGLFNAKQLIESWGGSIRLTSTPGRGTSISIQLPLTRGDIAG